GGDQRDVQGRARVEGTPAERGRSRRLALLAGTDDPLGPGLDEGIGQPAGRWLERRQEDDPVERRRPAQHELADAGRAQVHDLDGQVASPAGGDGWPYADAYP